MEVKISELEPVDELFQGCCFPLVQYDETKRVTYQTLKEQLSEDFISELETVENLSEGCYFPLVQHDEQHNETKKVTYQNLKEQLEDELLQNYYTKNEMNTKLEKKKCNNCLLQRRILTSN